MSADDGYTPITRMRLANGQEMIVGRCDALCEASGHDLARLVARAGDEPIDARDYRIFEVDLIDPATPIWRVRDESGAERMFSGPTALDDAMRAVGAVPPWGA